MRQINNKCGNKIKCALKIVNRCSNQKWRHKACMDNASTQNNGCQIYDVELENKKKTSFIIELQSFVIELQL